MKNKITACYAVGIFLIAAYLSLVNLGHSPLWHDEATPAFMGDNLWRNHTLKAWNGRTLYVGNNGTAANSNLLLASFPPWPAFPSALGIGIFGKNEFGVRIFHTLLGLAALLLFWKLLRLDFRAQPRLRVLAFALFALSTQVLLYMRLGRYVADAFFFSLASLYAYRLYIGAGGKIWHLLVAALATVINFLNHFSIGAAFALTLTSYHLIYYARQTSQRQWLEMSSAALLTAALCFAYLVSVGILFSGETLEFITKKYELPLPQRKVVLVYQNFRELLTLNFLPLWVALWFLWFVTAHWWRNRRAAAADNAPHHANLLRWGVMLLLFLLFSGLLSVRPPTQHEIVNSRYIAPALIFCALIIATFIEYLWQRAGRIMALVALALLLNTNLLAYPFVMLNPATHNSLRPLLPSLLREIHSPHFDYLSEALLYLNTHVVRDETIFVSSWQDYTLMQFYLSDQLIFCCALDENSPLPQQKVRQLGAPLYVGDVQPNWWVSTAPLTNPDYALVFVSQTKAYPTHRPELEHHTFAPQYKPPFLHIYRKIR